MQIGFLTMTMNHEDETEYAFSFEKKLIISRMWLTFCYAAAVVGFIGVEVQLLTDSDVNIFTTVGISITFVPFILCAVMIVELFVEKRILSQTLIFQTRIELCNTIVIVSVIGGCLKIIGRILSGSCEDGDNPRTCNPLHSAGFFPCEDLFLIGSIILFAQLVGCLHKVRVLVVCWLPLLVSLIVSVSLHPFINSASVIMAFVFMYEPKLIAYALLISAPACRPFLYEIFHVILLLSTTGYSHQRSIASSPKPLFWPTSKQPRQIAKHYN